MVKKASSRIRLSLEMHKWLKPVGIIMFLVKTQMLDFKIQLGCKET